MPEKSIMSIEITAQDIYNELKDLHNTVDQHTGILNGIRNEMKITNGRMLKAETCIKDLQDTNLVLWVKNRKWLLLVILGFILLTFGGSAVDSLKAIINFMGAIK